MVQLLWALSVILPVAGSVGSVIEIPSKGQALFPYPDQAAETFERIVAQNEVVLTLVYKDWCAYCKALKPEYQKAASILAANNSKVVLVQTQDAALMDRLKSKKVPAMFLFVNGKLQYRHWAWDFDDVYDLAWSFDALDQPVGFVYRHFVRLRSLYRFGLKMALKKLRFEADHPLYIYLPHALGPVLVAAVVLLLGPIVVLCRRAFKDKEKAS